MNLPKFLPKTVKKNWEGIKRNVVKRRIKVSKNQHLWTLEKIWKSAKFFPKVEVTDKYRVDVSNGTLAEVVPELKEMERTDIDEWIKSNKLQNTKGINEVEIIRKQHQKPLCTMIRREFPFIMRMEKLFKQSNGWMACVNISEEWRCLLRSRQEVWGKLNW